MNAARILAEMEAAGVAASVDGDRLKLRGKKPNDTLLEAIKASKAEIIAVLQAAAVNDQATPAPVQPDPGVKNGAYPPLRRAPFKSGLRDMPPEGLECATCHGTAWRQPAEGMEFLCMSCISPPPARPARILVGTEFWMSPGMVPKPTSVCRCCGKRRWGWSPTNRMGTGFDGWRKWSCARCMPSEVNYADTVFFDLEALEKGWK